MINTEVLFHDCDPTGYTHSSQHFLWFEQGRIKLLKEANINLSLVKDFNFMTVESYCKYKNAIRFGDLLVVETVLKQTEINRIIEFDYKIKKRLGGAEVANGKTKHVLTNMEGKLIPKIPVTIKDKLMRYLEGE